MADGIGTISGGYLSETYGHTLLEFSNADIRINDKTADKVKFKTSQARTHVRQDSGPLFICASLQDFKPQYRTTGKPKSDFAAFEKAQSDWKLWSELVQLCKRCQLELDHRSPWLDSVAFPFTISFAYATTQGPIGMIYNVVSITPSGRRNLLRNIEMLSEKIKAKEEAKKHSAGQRNEDNSKRNSGSKHSSSQSWQHTSNRTGHPLQHHYDILGIQPGASTNQIRKAYHNTARKFHSDKLTRRSGESEEQLKKRRASADEKMKKINEAYNELYRKRQKSITLD